MNEKIVQRVGKIVSVKILDRMMDRRTKNLSRMLGKSIAEAKGKIRLLLSIDVHFPGRSPETLLESLQFTKVHSDNIDRIAILGSNEFERTVIGLFGLFGGMNVRYFDKPDVVKAIMWLQEPP